LKLIKVTYRAVLYQPIRVLNPLELRMAGPVTVEVLCVGGTWRARNLDTRQDYEKLLLRHPSASAAMTAVDQNFRSRPNPWQMWGEAPDHPAAHLSAARPLEPREIALITKDGIERVYWKETEDYTHILHAPTMDPKTKVPPAACGISVKAEAFINNRANVEPTCLKCAQIWREHYQEKRA
jgi:hypothetical protein